MDLAVNANFLELTQRCTARKIVSVVNENWNISDFKKIC